eukprot:3941445-Prymnesium_polylepis.1
MALPRSVGGDVPRVNTAVRAGAVPRCARRAGAPWPLSPSVIPSQYVAPPIAPARPLCSLKPAGHVGAAAIVERHNKPEIEVGCGLPRGLTNPRVGRRAGVRACARGVPDRRVRTPVPQDERGAAAQPGEDPP